MPSGFSFFLNTILGFNSRKLPVFLICLLLAVLFWLLNAFTKDYNTILKFPVKYVNLPEDKVVVNELPQTLMVEVYGHGFNLLGYMLRQKKDTIIISGGYLHIRKIDSREYAYTSTKPMFEDITSQMKDDIRIKNILTDTLVFELENKLTKVVPVEPGITMDLEKQYLLSGEIQVIPEAVKITGPESIVDTIDKVKTKQLNYQKLDHSVTTHVNIPLSAHEKLTVSPSNVILKIPVEKFTEASKKIPLYIKNLPDSLSMKTFPDKIDVVYMVALSKYEKVDPQHFKAEVDYQDVIKDAPSKLKVRLTKSPDFVNLVKYSPERVEYIIQKKQ